MNKELAEQAIKDYDLDLLEETSLVVDVLEPFNILINMYILKLRRLKEDDRDNMYKETRDLVIEIAIQGIDTAIKYKKETK